VTGNTGIDALLWVSALLDGQAELRARVEGIFGGYFAEHKRIILMTGHRRESFDGGLARICQAMARIALRKDVAIVFPVHPNPNVRRATEPLHRHDNVLLAEPVDYLELVFLLKRCYFVVTDSGGIQEEAPSFGKPVLVTRDTTERPEAMEHGLAKLVGTDDRRLFDEMQTLLDDPRAYRRMSRVENPYGDGFASRRIAARLVADEGVSLASPVGAPSPAEGERNPPRGPADLSLPEHSRRQ
jgi:UDP-N-acetylglucosamine 2-epimerase (non-hydrolysing)